MMARDLDEMEDDNPIPEDFEEHESEKEYRCKFCGDDCGEDMFCDSECKEWYNEQKRQAAIDKAGTTEWK